MTGSGYGQPGPPRSGPGRPPPPAEYGPPAGYPQGFGVVGAVLAVFGAAGCVLAFVVLTWFRSGGSSVLRGAESNSTFSQIHDGLDKSKHGAQIAGISGDVHYGVAPIYFGWLAWVLLVVAAVFAILAVSPIGAAATAFRTVGALAGAAGLGVTLWAIDLIRVQGKLARELGGQAPTYTDWLKHTSFGAWSALAGFLLLGIGALTGPRRR